MDIDLLFTQSNEGGLIASENFAKKIAGILMDTETGLLTIEFVDIDLLEMNIPLEESSYFRLENNTHLHIGSVIDGVVAQAYQAPLMFLDDPYRGEALGEMAVPQPLIAFDYFLKNSIFGQPVNREDLSDEAKSGCILGDMEPAQLQFAPHLARKLAVELGPKATPNAPGMNAPGLGSGGATRGGIYRSGTQTSPTSGKDSGDKKKR